MRQIRIGKVCLTDGGEWNAAQGYPVLTYVRHNGDGWWSAKANVNSEPTQSNTNWVRATNVQSFIATLQTVTSEGQVINAACAAAEEIRKSNELLRVANETERVADESARVDAESARVTAESGRAAAESARVNAESARVTAETGRAADYVRAEGDRDTLYAGAEDERDTKYAAAESSRNTQFASAQTSRQTAYETAESGRSQAESARVTAESGRVAAETLRQSTFETAMAASGTATALATSKASDAQTAAAAANAASATAATDHATAVSDHTDYTTNVKGDVDKKYEKPAGGIPMSDLASDVSSAISNAGKADDVTIVKDASTGKMSVKDGGVSAAKIADKAVTKAKLGDDVAGDLADLALKVDENEKSIELLMLTLKEEQLAYGVEWDSGQTNPDVTRIGNMALHKSLPVQSLMRGCLLNDDGEVVKYLNANDWTSETRDGSQGQVMVELPEFYWKFVSSGTTRRVMMSLVPLEGYTKVQKMYVSAYEATVQRSTLKLASVVNNTADYRGGNNNAAWDDAYNSLLGMPATSISLTNFRTYARKRKAGSTEWNCNTYQVQKTLYWLYVVEYATRNSQKAYNAELTTDGYRQGGLGDGVSNVNSTKWSAFNGYNPFVKCGTTDSLGNNTGIVSKTYDDGNGGTFVTTNVPRYRGVENPFAHIWKWTDGIHVMVQSDADGGESKVYVSDDPSTWNDSNYNGYEYVGNEPRTSSYIKELLDGGDIMCKTNGGGGTSYFCDYHYVSIPSSGTALRGVYFGGHATYGAHCGFVCSYSSNSPSYANAYIGSRLCFIPRTA